MGNVTIKGNGDGLEILLSEKATYPVLREELLGTLRKNQNLFRNTDMRVVVRGKSLSPAQQKELKRVFSMDFGINDVLSGEEADRQKQVERDIQRAAQSRRRAAEAEAERDAVPDLVTRCDPNAESTFIMGTVRNGRRIESDGDIVVLGDVNPGAEILAGGNIAVFGKLRGLAHAGCSGDDTACIAAISLSPKQLRIAGRIVSFGERRETSGPEVAWLDQSGQVVVRPMGTRR